MSGIVLSQADAARSFECCLLSFRVMGIHKNAWLLMVVSAILQILIFPLPNLFILSWFALAPLLVALLRAREPDTLQLRDFAKLLPAKPLQGFVLGYVCGILWFAGTCYWIYDTMHLYGGLNGAAAFGILVLFCLYLGLYSGAFGLILCLLARGKSFSRRALLIAPAAWVAVELARTRITAFPWDLLGIAQVDNIPLARIATVTGVYGLSFEIMVVNAAIAAAFLVNRQKRNQLLLAAVAAAVALQAGRWVPAPSVSFDHTALLVQENAPILGNEGWTRHYFDTTLADLARLSTQSESSSHIDLIAWPESPAPFFQNDPLFVGAVSGIARETQTWMLVGNVGLGSPSTGSSEPRIFNSGALLSPQGVWTQRYDKVHLVPFGEYVPFADIFSFAGGLTKEVGNFTHGSSRDPLRAGSARLGVFICYESVFPDEVRQFAANGAQVFVNLSNDGWYGDSGAYAQHLRQARMRAVENSRWLLRDTNTGVTASIDPYGRVVASVPRKIRTVLVAPYALSDETTFYTRHGDWFAYLCAIILVVALMWRW